MSGGISQQFCVRWNSHLGSLGAAFPQLLAGQRFVDVTLACEGHQVHCHRLVLAACSSYFESLLGENPCKHPIIILPRDIKLWEIQALVDFMYKGEVNVSQAGLPDLLKCAEILQIRGLCGSDASLNLNQVASSNIPNQLPLSTPLNSHNNNILSNILTSTPKPTQNISLSPPTIKKPSQENLLSPNPTNKLPTQSSNLPGTPSTSTVPPQSQNTTATSNTQKEQSQTSATPIMDGPAISLDDGEDSMNESNSEIIEESELKIQEDYSDDNSIVKLEPELAMANVTCEYEGSTYASGRRVRRSETLLRQAAECVSRGQTFQTVSDMFHIPISTIRFFMARKGILPRRKRGRASGTPLNNDSNNHSGNVNYEQSQNSRSSSPSEPPFHFAHYKLPELRPKLV